MDKGFNQSKLSPIQDFEWKCVYDEGELDKIDVPRVELLLMNFEEEEDIERESINITLKNQQLTLQYLFKKYALPEK